MGMTHLAASFLSEEEQQLITQCVQRAERQTSGEIVPMIISASHDYPLASTTGAALFAFPVGLIGVRFIGGWFWMSLDPVWVFIACFVAFFAIARPLIQRSPRLLRPFIGGKRADLAVRDAATMAFFTERLYRTRDENGILLYISVLEKRVWILGDRGINDKIDSKHWLEIVSLVTDGIKQGRQCAAICEAITRIGDILRESFPIKPDDTNELHNLIIR